MSFLAHFIMRGRMQAIMVASTLAIVSLLFPPVSIVSSASVALVTLRRGMMEGLWVLLSASAASALLGVILFNNFYFALLYGLVLWLPIWACAVVLREGRVLSLALESAVLLGIAAILIFYGYSDNPGAVWQTVFEQMTGQLAQRTPDIQPEKIQQVLAFFAKFMTGIVASGVIYSMLFGLFLGRWWQSVLYNPGGFREEYLKLSVNRKLASASAIIIGVAFSGYGQLAEIAMNIAVLLFVLYTVIGAAVLHALISKLSNAQYIRFLTPMLYLSLTLIPQSMVIVALIGLLDAWLDLRNKQSNHNSA